MQANEHLQREMTGHPGTVAEALGIGESIPELRSPTRKRKAIAAIGGRAYGERYVRCYGEIDSPLYGPNQRSTFQLMYCLTTNMTCLFGIWSIMDYQVASCSDTDKEGRKASYIAQLPGRAGVRPLVCTGRVVSICRFEPAFWKRIVRGISPAFRKFIQRCTHSNACGKKSAAALVTATGAAAVPSKIEETDTESVIQDRSSKTRLAIA